MARENKSIFEAMLARFSSAIEGIDDALPVAVANDQNFELVVLERGQFVVAKDLFLVGLDRFCLQ